MIDSALSNSPIGETMTATPRPIVEVKGVTKTYQGGVEALSGISLDFPEGKLTTLLGPS